ncbi:winged helix-turn-helix domain-containing protein, partial [Acinetobacter baumannii]
DEIIEKVWDSRIVSDAAISSRIKSARQALGDDGRSQRFIRTVHRRGFRFVADVRVLRSEARVLKSAVGPVPVAAETADRSRPERVARPS